MNTLVVLFLITVTKVLCCDYYIDSNKVNILRGIEISFSTSSTPPISSDNIPNTSAESVSNENILNHIPENSILCLYGTNAEEIKNHLLQKTSPSLTTKYKIISHPSENILVSPKYAHDVLIPSKNPLIFHTEQGSIPHSGLEFVRGTIHLDTNRLETPPIWNLNSCEQNKKVFRSLGIIPSRHILLYGTRLIAGSRVFMALKECGVKNVYILNGGVVAWNENGFETSRKTVRPKPSRIEDWRISPQKKELVFWDQSMVQKYVNDEEKEDERNYKIYLLDTRTQEEYEGVVEGYDFVDKKGRIPKSIFFGEDIVSKDGPYSWTPFNEIHEKLRNLGIKRTDRIVLYCGTGWRASAFWVLIKEVLGFHNTVVYDGGWNEWYRNRKNPITSCT